MSDRFLLSRYKYWSVDLSFTVQRVTGVFIDEVNRDRLKFFGNESKEYIYVLIRLPIFSLSNEI